MRARSWATTIGMSLLGMTGALSAHAQQPPQSSPAYTPPPTYAAPTYGAPAYGAPMGEVESGLQPASGFGVEFLLGGGYSNFVGSTARSLTGGAGTWDIRMVFGSRLPVGFEAAYVGSAQDLNVTGLNTSAYLLGNGGEGSLRLAAPISRGEWLIAPFATAGVGWNYYTLQSTTFNTSTVRSHDTLLMVPLAVGIDAVYRGFLISARGTYRATFENDLFGNSSLDTWGVSGNLGFEF